MSAILKRTTPKVPYAFPREPGRLFRRTYATELPRPPPPTHEPTIESFSSTSKLRPYYTKHPPSRELPLIKKRWPILVAFAAGGVAAWAAFLTYVTNQEKISSSVVRQIMRSVRQDPELKGLLGEVIRPQPEWWLNGDPRIKGGINQLQGNVDVSFRLKGTKGAGTLYFTSIRRDKGQPFNILRFKVIGDDGTVIHVNGEPT